MSDEELYEKTKQYIWLSAYANNNPRSDYHWICDLCYQAWVYRDNESGYGKAYNEVYEENFG